MRRSILGLSLVIFGLTAGCTIADQKPESPFIIEGAIPFEGQMIYRN